VSLLSDSSLIARVLPAAVNWPSASGLVGFAPLSAMLEQQGFKLGIRIVRGTT
jgi:hypothetical protein